MILNGNNDGKIMSCSLKNENKSKHLCRIKKKKKKIQMGCQIKIFIGRIKKPFLTWISLEQLQH